MSITATNSGGSFELCPSGNHIARCYSMIEIGTIYDETFAVSRKLVRISWELPNEKKIFKQENGPQPFSIHKEYTLSMNEKANLRKDLESWRGKGFTEKEAEAFDITKLLGVPCMLNVIHKTSRTGKDYAMIASLGPVPKGTIVPDAINPVFVLSYNEWDQSKFDSLPEWLRKKIMETEEYKFIQSGGMETNEKQDKEVRPDDDLPF